MMSFIKAGEIRKKYQALEIELDDWQPQDDCLVIGAREINHLLRRGGLVEISRVVEQGDEVVISVAGTARKSTTGRALMFFINGERYSVPLLRVKDVISGIRPSAPVSRLVEASILETPIFDADKVQVEAEARIRNDRPIDEGLEKWWF